MIADRSQLLDAAERAIRANGPNVTMDAIAVEAGVTKPILYRGVGDKDALVAALSERLADRITSRTEVVPGGEPRESLRQMIAGHLTTVDDHSNLYLFVTAGGSSSDRVDQSLHLGDRWAIPMAEMLAVARGSGPDDGAASTWAYGILGMLHFAALAWLRDPSSPADRIADHLTELLWSGLGGAA